MVTVTTTYKKRQHKALTVTHAQKLTTMTTNPVQAKLWYPMCEVWGRALRISAAGMGYTHTSRAVPPSSKC